MGNQLSLVCATLLLFVGQSHVLAFTSTRGSLKMVLEPLPRAEILGSEAKDWSPSSWRGKDVAQMPVYEDEAELEEVEARLRKVTPLVFAGECRKLQDELSKVCRGQGFLLMGGDCAESFSEFSVDHIRDTFKIILQMSLVLTFGSGLPVTKIGRMAGQFAKPRSEPTETKDGVTLPSYRGDNVNGEDFTPEARRNDPERMMTAYNQCAQTLNILRAFATGGDADITKLQRWNLEFVDKTEEGSKYRKLAEKVAESIRFMKAIGVNTRGENFKTVDFYTAHECLLLPYEQALTRVDSTSGRYYDCSASMLWIGERTRQLDMAHLEFVRGVGNPLGVKVSDKSTPEGLLGLLDTINPDNIPGRVTIITRMGAEKIREHLPVLIEAVQDAGRNVVWISDPVHANTIKTDAGFKTRPFDRIRDELRAFFDVHEAMGSHPGGVHLEMTGEDVTECIGGNVNEVIDLSENYKTACDPRLNGAQALELAFLISERMRKAQGLEPLW
mmetsp:Transcript_24540/g.38673  ORF Transcript_24540/g.38673 Transcript_24540/m.38673 type:complete len:500 (+) Transcript_24540:54-1553(+)